MQQWQVGPVPEYIYNTQHPNDMHSTHPYQPDMTRRNEFANYQATGQNPAVQTHQQHGQQQPHHQQPPHGQHQSHQSHQTHPSHPQHGQHQPQHSQHQSQPQHHQQHHTTTPVPAPMTVPTPGNPPTQQQSTPTQTPAQPASRGRKRPAPGSHQGAAQPPLPTQAHAGTPTPAPAVLATPVTTSAIPPTPATTSTPIPPPSVVQQTPVPAPTPGSENGEAPVQPPPVKKSRTNTPWTPAEELRLKQMRDAGASWAEIAKTFPTRTEGSVKKHWYKDMHYAEFAEDESQALANAIKEYENNKWKAIGAKVGKPAKACEQYAKEHFPDLFGSPKQR
ncbi:hypothetical protein F5Y17DRAFT_354453 [Xylariaceae sp. FL0594]|nr:hypothetical protein F5Y17DRAFT_354453 [Xylariaceae sp. FL0594]